MALFGNPYTPTTYGNYAPTPYTQDGTLGRNLLEDNPHAIWQQLLDQLLGITSGRDQRSQFLEGQYNNWYGRYLSDAAQGTDPGYGFSDFVQKYGQQINQSYDNAAPQERGENPSRFAPRMRFVGFPG